MRKQKKLLSVLLSALMLLSVFSAGLVAFAADKSAAVVALEEKVTAYVNNPGQDTTLEGYKALVTGWQALSESEKDSMDILLFDQLAQLMFKYETSQLGSSSTANKKIASETVIEQLNYSAVNDAKKAFDDGFYASSTDGAAKQAIYNSLGERARLILGTASGSSYCLFYRPLSNATYYNYALYFLINKLWTEAKAEAPYTGSERPDYDDYEGGYSDPAYKNDASKYNADKGNYEAALLIDIMKTADPDYATIGTFAEMAVAAMDAFRADNNDYAKVVEALEYYESMSESVKATLNGSFNYFRVYYYPQTDGSSASAKNYALDDVPAALEEMASYQNVPAFVEYMEALPQDYTAQQAEKVRELYFALPQEYLGSIDATLVARAQAIIKEVIIAGVKDQTTPDISGFVRTNVTYPAGASYSKVTNSIPKMDTLVAQIVNLAAGSDLQTMISTGLYTNATIESIVKALYPAIGGAGLGPDGSPAYFLEVLNKSVVLDANGNDAFRGAKAALEGKTSWDEVTFKDGDFFRDGDSEGFAKALAASLRIIKDLKYILSIGDMVLEAVQFENIYDAEAQTYSTGLYEDLYVIFEALGIEPVMDSIAYTDAIDACTAAGDDYAAFDAKLVPILDTVFNYLNQLAANPVTAITELLPKLAYAIDSNLLTERVAPVLARLDEQLGGLIGMVGGMLPDDIGPLLTGLFDMIGEGFDLSTEGIFNTIGKLLDLLGVSGVKFEETTNSAGDVLDPDQGVLTITVTLQEGSYDSAGNQVVAPVTTDLVIYEADFIQFIKDMAGCGTAEVAQSGAVTQAQRVNIVSDKADAFVTLVRFVYDDVLMKNIESVKAIVANLEPTFGTLLGPVFDVIKQVLPADAAIVALVTIADPLPEMGGSGSGSGSGGLGSLADILAKIREFFGNLFTGGGIGDIPIIGDIINGIGDLLGGGGENNPGGGEGTEQTGDPNIPTTGSTVAGIASSAIALAVGAAVTLLAVKSRRDRED